METIKSYTDISQSKKLAEILPLESADALHCVDFDGDLLFTIPKQYSDLFRHQPELIIPCWSLVALLDVLPILDNRSPVIPKTFDEKYRVVYHSTACERGIFTHDYDNPVDACYEMIIKLHKQKLL